MTMENHDDSFARDCGMDRRSWQIRVENDFGPHVAARFDSEVEATITSLNAAQETSEPTVNTDLLLHQQTPEVFPDPQESNKTRRRRIWREERAIKREKPAQGRIE